MLALLLSSVLPTLASPWDQYIHAPSSRFVIPPSYISSGSTVPLTFPKTLQAPTPTILIDFEKEVGGFISFTTGSCTASNISLFFSESLTYALVGDISNGGSHDGPFTMAVTAKGSFTLPPAALRGGFRYLYLTIPANSMLEVTGLTLRFTAAPLMSDLRAYRNYFYSSDDLLNRIWYAGAYTVQMNLIDPKQGRIWPPPAKGWNNSEVVGVGASILVDGAKRDRMVWPGDIGISSAVAYASVGDVLSVRNALTTLYNCQDRNSGMFSFVGPPIGNWYSSDTYHLWTLYGTYKVYQYTADKEWVNSVWPQFQKAMQCSIKKIGKNGLMVVDGTADWARFGQGGENIAANALLFGALQGAAELATALGDQSLAGQYLNQAKGVQSAINSVLWDANAGAYKDNPTAAFSPQDGNSIAVWMGVTDDEKAASISKFLTRNWNNFGAKTPEWGGNIGTFPGGMEVMAHFIAGQPDRALKLITTQWGYMLQHPNSTGSTFWEGFNADGTFAYDGDYMSHAHGWGAGPTAALTFHVLGIQPITAGGARYQVVPSYGQSLTRAEGQLALDTNAKVVRVAWEVSSSGAVPSFKLDLDATSNPGSLGDVAIPLVLPATALRVLVNGVLAWTPQGFQGAPGIQSADVQGSYVYFRGVSSSKFSFATA